MDCSPWGGMGWAGAPYNMYIQYWFNAIISCARCWSNALFHGVYPMHCFKDVDPKQNSFRRCRPCVHSKWRHLVGCGNWIATNAPVALYSSSLGSPTGDEERGEEEEMVAVSSSRVQRCPHRTSCLVLVWAKAMPELAKSWSPSHTRKVGKPMPELAKTQEPQTHKKSRQNHARTAKKQEPQTHWKSR